MARIVTIWWLGAVSALVMVRPPKARALRAELVEVRDGSRRSIWTPGTRRETGAKRRHLKSLFRRVFVPDDVINAYYSYSLWRCLQRLLSATVNVFGLQAMIMAVGRRDAASGHAIGVAAAIDWVLKDALGKVTRLVWAGRMGREFDGDAKRWRFRASLLYATGNGLQIATLAWPHLFLPIATLANCLKQISLLTSTATRSAIYRSFAVTDATNNIGDITAKGEAQIAVVDLMGMTLGITLSKKIGFAACRRRMLIAYACLSILEICAMYREIRSVVFRQLNLERAAMVTQAFTAGDAVPGPIDAARRERLLLTPLADKRKVFPSVSSLKRHGRTDLAPFIALFDSAPYFLAPTTSPDAFAVILHTSATQDDILQALLALAYATKWRRDNKNDLDVVAQAKEAADVHISSLKDAMQRAGWATTSFMFPDVRVRADWGEPLEEQLVAAPRR